MISTLSISRFKSISSLTLQCRKVNVFIGEPDTGKTNILDALTFLSCLGWNLNPALLLRLNPHPSFDSLFHRQFFDQPFSVAVDDETLSAQIQGMGKGRQLRLTSRKQRDIQLLFGNSCHMPEFAGIAAYLYTSSTEWGYRPDDGGGGQAVAPPHGNNLLYLARHDSRAYDFLKDQVASIGWKLRFDTGLERFFMSEIQADEIRDYNLDLLSDSLKRLFFYGAILITSQGRVLVLDEPDVYAFPPYPKLLGEMIGNDETNQFFVTTHNPYFLAGVVQKTPKERLAVHVCSRDPDGTTATTLLDDEQVATLIELGPDVFFNLERLCRR